jgi:hypothetical protein
LSLARSRDMYEQIAGKKGSGNRLFPVAPTVYFRY